MVISYYTITALINFLTSFILAVLVILKNRKNPKNVSFFILAIVVAVWSLCYFFWQNVTNNESLALFWCRALMAPSIFMPSAFFHFVLAVTGELEKRKKFLIFLYILLYFFLLTDATPFFVKEVKPIMNFKYWPMATPIMTAWLAVFLACIIYSWFLLVKKYSESSGITKLQLKYVSIGLIISSIAGTMNFVPWYRIPIPPVTHGLVPVYVILIAYAITRYRLMDVKTIIRNIVFYILIIFFIFLSFYVVFFVSGYLFGFLSAIIITILIYINRKILSNFLDKHLFYFIYVYKQVGEEATQKLSKNIALDEVANVIIDATQKTLQSKKVALLICNKKNSEFIIIKKIGFTKEDLSALDCGLFSKYFTKNPGVITREELEQNIQDEKDVEYKSTLHSIENQIYQNNISICVPIINASLLLGIIIIGKEMYENAFSTEDFKLLEVLSEHASLSLEKILDY